MAARKALHGDPLTEAYFYLSEQQRSTMLGIDGLKAYADELPCWLPHRIVANALGHGTAAIDAAEKALGGPYVWATEFDNAHTLWMFDEPGFLVDGIFYKATENYLQAQKQLDLDEEAKRRIAEMDPHEAYTAGHKLILRDDWEEVKYEIMKTGHRAKYEQNEWLRGFLLSTGDYPLAVIGAESEWKIGLDGQGQNKLGVLLMELRAELRAARD